LIEQRRDDHLMSKTHSHSSQAFTRANTQVDTQAHTKSTQKLPTDYSTTQHYLTINQVPIDS